MNSIGKKSGKIQEPIIPNGHPSLKLIAKEAIDMTAEAWERYNKRKARKERLFFIGFYIGCSLYFFALGIGLGIITWKML